MQIIDHNSVVAFDVDSTLVMHLDKNEAVNCRYKWVSVEDPLNSAKTISVVPNEPMIRLLREELHCGKMVIVWSRGRYEWALAVLLALDITHENLVVMSKPETYFDDKPCEQWMGPRVWIDPNEVYKNKG